MSVTGVEEMFQKNWCLSPVLFLNSYIGDAGSLVEFALAPQVNGIRRRAHSLHAC
ncbi:hypothetical protein [Pseudoduganella umbonata]|uniref:Uncharacterized protein n=1 Tax=Pseudoduganella umbonata TaxID=864828 RepID=A0A7W5E855_9BURK|nr:hypothetical protein [Pseudoduganella umbonata]MBB3220341.1 hypothetical protein [Pseudoduganella umbonata]